MIELKHPQTRTVELSCSRLGAKWTGFPLLLDISYCSHTLELFTVPRSAVDVLDLWVFSIIFAIEPIKLPN